MNVLALLYILATCLLGDSKVYRSIVWSPENPIFKQTRIKCILPTSRLFIVCPSISFIVADRDGLAIKDNLYENLWFVNRQAYDSCQVNQEGRLLKRCNTPLTQSRYNFMFIETNPISGGLEFDFGKDYYIIATSNGTEKSLTNREGGHCKTHDMKLRLHICNDSKDPHCLNEENCQHLERKPTANPVDPSIDIETPLPTRAATTRAATTDCNITNTTKLTTPYGSVPPNSRHYFTSIEVYKLGIGLLVLVTIIFLSTTIYLGIRFYRLEKIHADCIVNKNARLTRASNGSTVVTFDSVTLITGTESEAPA